MEKPWVEPRDKTILSGRSNVKIMWRFSLDGFTEGLGAPTALPAGRWNPRWGFARRSPYLCGIGTAIDDARMRDRT
jgi:hypothetical protein